MLSLRRSSPITVFLQLLVTLVSVAHLGFAHTGGPEKTVTVWPRTVVPATVSNNDPQAVELGMKFRSRVGGLVTGVMFYKSTSNTGSHTGHLWTAAGTLLASVTFTDETPSGWQAAYFASPVPISANTTYVISYHTDTGYYSTTSNYFASTTGGVFTPPLTALASGVDGSNGVYKYGASAFPNLSYNNTNYWVDVIFNYPDAGALPVYPSTTTIETGTLNSGTVTNLNIDDDSYYRLNSTTSGTRTISWYATFTNVMNDLQGLRVSYKGRNSRNCTETLSIYNWATSSWVQLDSRTVGTTEIARVDLAPLGTFGDFVSGITGFGDVRVRVRCTATANFNTYSDLLSIVYDPPPVLGTKPTITSPAPNAVISGTTVNVTYTTSGDLALAGVSHVHFSIDSTLPVMDTTMDGVFQFTNVQPGPHVIKAFFVRSDHSYIPGTDATPVAFTTTAAAPLPKPVITSPTAGQAITGTTVNVNYAVSGDMASVGASHVHFILDSGAAIEESPVDGVAQLTNVSTGNHTLQAFLVRADHSTISGTDATPVAFTTTVPAIPKPVITSPTATPTLIGTTVNVVYSTVGDLAAAGVSHLHFVLDSGAAIEESPIDGTAQLTNVAPGAHTLQAFLVRADHSTISGTDATPVTFTTTTTPPKPVITSPTPGQTVSSATVDVTYTISGDAASVGAAHVHFVMDSGAHLVEFPMDGVFQFTNVASGAHTLQAYFARADHSTIQGTDAVPVSFTTEVTDAIPPEISITSPAGGATVTGTVSTTVNASDNTAVVGVLYKLDGGNVNPEITTPPFSLTWSSAAYPNGQHLLTATARDAAGNTTVSAPISVNIFNTSPAGLVSAYSFNEASGTTVTDSSASQNHGTISGAPRVAGKFGGALSFNGVNSLVTIPNSTSLGLTTGMTIMAWLNPAVLTGYQTVINKEAPGNFAWALDANDSSNRPGVWVRIGTSTHYAKGTQQLPLNTWSHLAGTYDGTVLRFYLNGALISSTNVAGQLTATSNPLQIGGNTVWPDEWVNGIIDEVRVYNRALTASEVQSDMNSPIALPGGPKLIITSPTQNQAIPSTTLDITYTTTGDLTAASVDHVHFVLDATPYKKDQPMDGAIQYTDVPPGTHTLSGFLVRANHSYIEGTEATPITFTTVGMDSIPPTVSITSPATGATITGNATVSANASDNQGVVGVQFQIDGADLGPEDTTSPYSWSWNSAAYANGAHTLTARARDASGNVTVSTPVNVTLSNTADPSVTGVWSPSSNWPTVGVHIALMHTGQVLVFEGIPGLDGAGQRGGVWDPTTGAFTSIQDPPVDLFCAGHAALPDGRILVVGGHGTSHIGIADVNIFNPVTRAWSTAPSMAFRRWYPTATGLPDGRVLVTSGADLNDRDYVPIPEVYNPATNSWSSLTSANLRIPAYPHIFVLPDGQIAYTGSDEAPTEARKLNVATQSWSLVDANAVDGGASVMYDFGKFMKSGMSGDDPNVRNATSTTFVIDMTAPTPRWQQTADMNFPRSFHNLTQLPDGNVLLTSGTRRTDSTQPVYEAEMWSPVTKTWTTMARGSVPRMYHSSALLLPDARVLVAGSGRLPGMVDQRNYEIYSPPYLFKGTRPTITSAPTVVNYGSSFFVATPDGSTVTSVVLMRPGSMTHEANMDQRRVPMTFSQAAGGLQIQAPANGNYAPPGYYMLFLLNANGVPSVATFLRFPAPFEDLQAPGAPSDLQAAGSVGTVVINWPAASDNIGVVRYNVHRSATFGFTPSAANRIAQPTTTNYTDVGLAAGRYYYRVTAEDLAGNVGPSSPEAVADVLADTIPPTVTLTSPSAGSTVSNTISLTADATDDRGIAGVQFLVDGNAAGSEDTTAPYSVSWNSSTVPNGSHQVTARARDTGGNLTSSPAASITVSNTVSSGLVAAYNFNELSGSTALDSSGNANNGSIANATRVPGKFGNALSFNGTNAMVTITGSSTLNLTTGMTLEAWVNPVSLSSFRVILMKELASTDAWALNANDGINRPGVWARTGSAGSTIYGARGLSQLALNTWTHIAGTYDGTMLRFYVNGTLVTSTTLTGSLVTSTNALRIGGTSLWSEWFNGLIDEVRIYNRALSQTEINTDMNSAIP